MSEKVMVIGADGFIGQHISSEIEESPYLLTSSTKYPIIQGGRNTVGMDITRPSDISHIIKRESPDIIINSAGLISVVGCEHDPKLARTLNETAIGEIASAGIAAKVGLICHLSTDAVFSGNTEGAPFSETDVPVPMSVYGKTKREGEKNLESSGSPYYIIRTSVVIGDMLYPSPRVTFQHSVIESLTANKEFHCMTDAINSPTMVEDVVGGILYLIRHFSVDKNTGIFHLAGPQPMSKYDLAKLIATRHGLNSELIKPTTRDKIDPHYPPNTSLDSHKVGALGFITHELFEASVPA